MLAAVTFGVELRDPVSSLTHLFGFVVAVYVTGLLWRLAFLGFSWYVRDLSRFSIHGSIAAVIVFLVWIYVCSVILLYGVEFTVSYARLRRLIPDDVTPPVEPASAPSS